MRHKGVIESACGGMGKTAVEIIRNCNKKCVTDFTIRWERGAVDAPSFRGESKPAGGISRVFMWDWVQIRR